MRSRDSSIFEVWIEMAGFLPDLRSWWTAAGVSGKRKHLLDAENKLRCEGCSNGLGVALSREAYTQLRATQRLSPSDYTEVARHTPIAAQREIAQMTRQLIERVLERQPRGLRGDHPSRFKQA